MELICFSHLRWGFVYQRPQHLLTRFARLGPVHVWEEPEYGYFDAPGIRSATPAPQLQVITPTLPQHLQHSEESLAVERELLERYVADAEIADFVAWYYTPMALRFTQGLKPNVTVYDCMDELSAFQGAPPALVEEEKQLFVKADVVFAGGASLYASKRTQHGNVHLFSSSVDRDHFSAARIAQDDPEDQQQIPHPRIGFYGVLDERLDRDLVRDVAAAHPEWHLVLLGPVVKIREDELPQSSNIHYLGQKTYAQLPAYLANWDVAMLPFARNASTRFISPTKTPEYLAGGKPVVSTPITDVVTPYADLGLVRIGESPEEFAHAIAASLTHPNGALEEKRDAFLADLSWDKTFEGMWQEIQRCMQTMDSNVEAAQAAEEVEANV